MLTASNAIIEQLGEEHRHVVSQWRALVLLRRATRDVEEAVRRWKRMPRTESDIVPIVRTMVRGGQFDPLVEDPPIYRVVVPFARTYAPDVRDVVTEINPFAIVSHASALEFHGLIDTFLQRPMFMTPSFSDHGLLPLGTVAEDWNDLTVPSPGTPTTVLDTAIEWHVSPKDEFFGFDVYQPYGTSVRVMTPERALVEGLRTPTRCGGIEVVLSAWANARWNVDVDVIVQITERLESTVLRQRVGFVLEDLGMQHPRLDEWSRSALRGGSSKLVAATPYAPEYSTRWKISLNAPVSILRASHA